MKYSIATIDCNGLEEWQTDVLIQELADLGFDSFEQDEDILRAYIPTDLLATNSAQIDEFCQHSPFDIRLSIESCPDENWNAVWEASHTVEELPLGVRITPHCAFGAGHHETTAMMIDELLARTEIQGSGLRIQGSSVLDQGTGTGVLAIFAKRLGATHVLAVDIDENSVRNAQENAAANDVQISVQQGSTVPEGPYDLILANIHRNVLVAQMPDYARNLSAGGELWLSGFYESDVPVLIHAAEAEGLQPAGTRANGEWRLLICRK